MIWAWHANLFHLIAEYFISYQLLIEKYFISYLLLIQHNLICYLLLIAKCFSYLLLKAKCIISYLLLKAHYLICNLFADNTPLCLLSTVIHHIHRLRLSDWSKQGHMTWKLIHVLVFTIPPALKEEVTAAEFGTSTVRYRLKNLWTVV